MSQTSSHTYLPALQCIQELRHKAEYFGRTGIVPTLDATHSIAKSDLLVPRELHLELREAFARLRADQANSPDWHPNTNETVLDLVHPSTYPLVYGRSRFLPHEVVGVDDAVNKWAGKGDVIPRNPEWGEEPTTRQTWRWGTSNRETAISESGIHSSYWSTIYQWLPANVNFTDDGGVKFTSYINNLHPTKYRRIYGTIEKLIKTALPMWDQCLAQYTGEMVGPGRHVPRMVPENPEYVCLRLKGFFVLMPGLTHHLLVTKTRSSVCNLERDVAPDTNAMQTISPL